MFVDAALAWLFLLVVMFGLGAARELWLKPKVGEPRAHRIGTLVACAAVLGFSYGFDRITGPGSSEALAVGALWVTLTLLFEFGFFHYVMRKPWSELLADYRIDKGRLWLLVLLSTLLAPWLMR